MIQIIPLLTSIFTILGMWLAGNHDHRAWYVGIANQGLWLTFIIMFHAWGLLPLLTALLFVYTRNLIRWKKENVS